VTVRILDNDRASRFRRADKNWRSALCEDYCACRFEAREDCIDIPDKKDKHRGARILQPAANPSLFGTRKFDEFNATEHTGHSCTDKA
jgi:hypothetical protein